MGRLEGLKPASVFKYFEEICAIPHGSGDMVRIADYCVSFAKEQGLEYVRDSANNVIIYKNGTQGMENHPPVILQGHTDMVCQKTAESTIDFEKDGLDIYVDGDFVKANGTTLGADNGIAVAMIMAILASDNLAHPPIEAVFTTDEEIGMIGAGELDVSLLKGRRMINLDSEEENVLTVSCAGGSNLEASRKITREASCGKMVTVTASGLVGGHSGVEIHKGRVNANILMGRILTTVKKSVDFEIISINGGDKSNAIPNMSCAELCVKDEKTFADSFEKCREVLLKELKSRENDMEITCKTGEDGEYQVMSREDGDAFLAYLLHTPDGIVTMSCEIEGLVETSLNLGILETREDEVYMQYALRSNKASALDFLEMKMSDFAKDMGYKSRVFARYEPWEYKENSELRTQYIEAFEKNMGYAPKVEAIHAGLECAVFSASVDGLDCIAIGPDMWDVHTVSERLSISSVGRIYGILCDILAQM